MFTPTPTPTRPDQTSLQTPQNIKTRRERFPPATPPRVRLIPSRIWHEWEGGFLLSFVPPQADESKSVHLDLDLDFGVECEKVTCTFVLIRDGVCI